MLWPSFPHKLLSNPLYIRPFQVISLFLIKMRVGFWPDFQKKQTKLYLFFGPFSSNGNIETNKNHVNHLSFDGMDRQINGNTGLVPFVTLPFIINVFSTVHVCFWVCFLCVASFVFSWLPGRFFDVKFTRNKDITWNGLRDNTLCPYTSHCGIWLSGI